MNEMHDVTEAALAKAGSPAWPDRPRHTARATLESNQYAVTAAVAEFLERFGGISIEWETSEGSSESLHAHVDVAVTNEPRSNVSFRSAHQVVAMRRRRSLWRLHGPLSRIDGRVFVGADDTLKLAGANTEEALDNIVVGFEFRPA